MFRIIFVLDILNGKVVHAVKGEREKYGPIHNFSKVCESSDPLHIVDELSPRELYIADLNRLEGSGNNDDGGKCIKLLSPVYKHEH
jgi:phosphoribosylformimino-5-aminoimidazole carboxamide ribotide isomerase